MKLIQDLNDTLSPDGARAAEAPGVTAGEPAARASRSEPTAGLWKALSRVPPELPIFLLYLLLAAYLTWPVLRSFNHNFYGFPSDNLGTMWGWWWSRNAGSFGATPSFSPLIGYPFGQQLAPWTGEIVSDLFVRFMLLFAPQTFVYNLIITTSFALAGVTMYFLVRYVTVDRRVAFFGGIAYLVGAFHAVHAMLFVNLSMVQWMPLYILALLVFMKKPVARNALLLFLASLLVVGTSVHYGLFMAVFTIAFLLGRFAYLRIRQARLLKSGEIAAREPVVLNRKTLLLSLLVVLLVVAVVFPLFLLGNRRISQAGNWPTRSTPGGKRELETDRGGSASPLAYLLPEKENFFLGPITRKLAPERVNSYENSLYLGVSLMALAGYWLVISALAWRSERKRRSPDREPAKDEPGAAAGQGAARGVGRESRVGPGGAGEAVERKALTWGLMAAAAVAFILSMPPYFDVGLTKVPLPSIILHYTVPWLRWYMRFGVVVIICVILLACLGLSYLLRSQGKTTGWLALVFFTVFLFLEMTIVPPLRYFTIADSPPGVFNAIAGMDVRAQVIYPAFEPGFFNAQRYLLYQEYTKKPMLNGGLENSDGEALRRTVYNPFNPQTPGILRRFGVTHVIYLDRMFEEYEGTEKAEKEVTYLPPGLRLIRQVGGDDYFGKGHIYLVTADKADLVPIYQGDITVPHIDQGRVTVRLMEHQGVIRIVNYSGRDIDARVRIPVSNLAFPHDLTLTDGRSVLWRGKLTGDQATVIDLGSVRVPRAGLVLNLSAAGSRLVLSGSEAEVYGTGYATIRLGDAQIESAGGARAGGVNR